jgi:nitroimidazol reductase NimA-like FMN-containing flavoprotein (pyridoxamine 5'-phosphate oxidase superfamily)
MVIREMTEQECRAMLGETHVARLACARHNQPYVVPIHVDFHGDALYGYATLGQKIEWMRQNPLVCLEVSRQVAERLFQRHPVWWEPASVPLAGHERRTPIVFRIWIDRVSGRRAEPDAVNTVDVPANASHAKQARWLPQVLRRIIGRE